MVSSIRAQQQRIESPVILRPQSRAINPLNLDAEDPLPQPFRRAAVPLFRGRGFSLDGQEPKFVPIDQPVGGHPTFNNDKSTSSSDENSSSSESIESEEYNKPKVQPTARQTLFQQYQQQQPERNQQQVQLQQQQQQTPQILGFKAQVRDHRNDSALIIFNDRVLWL